MSPRSHAIARGPVLCLAAIILALGVSACGRRGPLEAPPDPSAPAAAKAPAKASGARANTTRSSAASSTGESDETAPASLATQPQSATLDTPDDEAASEDPDKAISPLPTPAAPNTRRRGRGFTIPKEPFILDPIL